MPADLGEAGEPSKYTLTGLQRAAGVKTRWGVLGHDTEVPSLP